MTFLFCQPIDDRFANATKTKMVTETLIITLILNKLEMLKRIPTTKSSVKVNDCWVFEKYFLYSLAKVSATKHIYGIL